MTKPNHNFGRNIRLVRVAQNLTLDDLAHISGVNITYLSKCENGRHNISLSKALDIARALEVTIDDIMQFDYGKSPLRDKMRAMLNHACIIDGEIWIKGGDVTSLLNNS